MKKSIAALILALLCLVATKISLGQLLRVEDPQGWGSGRATIEEATLSIRPQGAYMEYGLYLTISPRGSHYSSVHDTLEIVLNFKLPEKAIIHDSWLWVGNDIVKAMLIDKITASAIYEGIVNRRKDPSILTKDRNDRYQLRVFPLAGNETRKVKISYLVPVDFNSTSISAQLPMEILKLSYDVPDLEILSYEDTLYRNSRIHDLGNINFTQTNVPGQRRAEIPAATLKQYIHLSFGYDSPTDNGIIAFRQPTSANEGFYQVMVNPKEVFNIERPKKTLFLIDYHPDNSDIPLTDIYDEIREIVQEDFNPADSFNICVLANSHAAVVQPNWLPATSASINTAYTNLPAILNSGPEKLGTLINRGATFIRDNGAAGEMILITNDASIQSRNAINNFIGELVTNNSLDYPVNVFNFYGEQRELQSLFGNEYMLVELADITGGHYQDFEYKSVAQYDNNGWIDYYYRLRTYTFSQAMSKIVAKLDGSIFDTDLYSTINNGYCYSRLGGDQQSSVFVYEPIIQVGRYYGSGPIEVTFSGFVGNDFYQQTLNLTDHYPSDTLTNKIWAGCFIDELELNYIPLATQRTIIDTSMAYRVLSEYTAFLALEPSDTISVCDGCVDETEGGGVIPTPIKEPDVVAGSSVSVSPNPFTSNANIVITLPATADLEQVEIAIYSIDGKLVRRLLITENVFNGELTLTWDGTDNSGAAVVSGVYTLMVKTKDQNLTKKLIKL